MKNLVLAILAMLAAGTAEAAKINQGNFELGGSFSLFEKTFGSGEGLLERVRTWPLSIDAQYFLFDHFSAGLETSWWTGGPLVSFGPTAAYYLPVTERIAPFVMVSPLSYTTRLDASHYSEGVLSTVKLGTKFFLTDSLAIGPALEFEHRYETNSNNLRLSVMTSIHF